MAIVYLGIGSNIGDRQANLNKAVELLAGSENINVLEISSFYFTKPVEGPSQEDFLNGVLNVETNRSPEDLLFKIKEIEREMGREPAERNFPRIIDIDILLYDDLVTDRDDLTIPHPRMHERDFVLKGFKEISGDKVHPVLKKTIERIYAENNKYADNKYR